MYITTRTVTHAECARVLRHAPEILMLISDLGEFGLIELIRQWTQRSVPGAGARGDNPAYRIAVGNGDDAAAAELLRTPLTELYTTDTMVDGAHFTARTTPWRDLGWKALASNISDIAAMGGQPALALVTLGLPPATPVDNIRELYAGMNEIAAAYGAQIIGGDLVRSPTAFITVALTGVTDGAVMVRSAARPGHQVAVSGPVGGSAGGLRLLLDADTAAGSGNDNGNGNDGVSPEHPLVKLHRRPCPHTAAGRILAASGVGSAMDVSDGLADDLGKLGIASGVAARIMVDRVPVIPILKDAYPEDWPSLALYGGEDYVLLFTAAPAVMATAIAGIPDAAVIGEIVAGTPGAVEIIGSDGNPVSANAAGWDHFAGAR